MKKLFAAGIIFLALFVFAIPTNAKKPDTSNKCTTIQSGELLASDGSTILTGYDEWGYNYQAKMFNGKYCDAYRDAAWCQEWKDDNLMMKWNDAWLSNKDCDEDGLLDRHLGFNSYIGSGAWLTNHQSGEYGGEWNLVGDWVLDFVWHGGHYVHDMTIVDNTFKGTGVAQFSTQTWAVTGTIVDDNINMHIAYDGSTYTVDVIGIIAPNGTMSGSWKSSSNQTGDWTSTGGRAQKEKVYYWNYFTKIVAAPAGAYKSGGTWFTADGVEIGPVIWGSFAIIQEVYNDTGTGEHGILYKGEAPKGFGFYQP